MPRYVFTVSTKSGRIRHEHAEFGSDAEACADGLLWAAEILSPASAQAWTDPSWRLVVSSEAGAALCDINITGARRSTARRVPIAVPATTRPTLH